NPLLAINARDVATGKIAGSITVPLNTGFHPWQIASIVHPGTRRLLVIENKSVQLVDIVGKKPIGEPCKAERFWFAQLSPDGKRFVAVDVQNNGLVRNVETGKEWTFATRHNWLPIQAGFPAGDELYLGFYDGTLLHYEPNDHGEFGRGKLGSEGWEPH